MRLAYQEFKKKNATKDDVLDAMCEYMNIEDHTESMQDYLGMNDEEYTNFVLHGEL